MFFQQSDSGVREQSARAGGRSRKCVVVVDQTREPGRGGASEPREDKQQPARTLFVP